METTFTIWSDTELYRECTTRIVTNQHVWRRVRIIIRGPKMSEELSVNQSYLQFAASL
jgi:hypothetical protein